MASCIGVALVGLCSTEQGRAAALVGVMDRSLEAGHMVACKVVGSIVVPDHCLKGGVHQACTMTELDTGHSPGEVGRHVA
jgi:hypothetical protein